MPHHDSPPLWAVHLGPSGVRTLPSQFYLFSIPQSDSMPPHKGGKKILSPPPSVLEANANGYPPLYDSRVHGLTRLLGTSPPVVPLVCPPSPPPVCLPVRLSFLVASLPPDRPAVDPKRSRHASFSMVGAAVPALASFSSCPRGFVRPGASLHHCRPLYNSLPTTVNSTLGHFLVLP